MKTEVLVYDDDGDTLRLRLVFSRPRDNAVRAEVECGDYKAWEVFRYDTPQKLMVDVMEWLRPVVQENMPVVVLLSRQQISNIIAAAFFDFGRRKAHQVTGLPPQEG